LQRVRGAAAYPAGGAHWTPQGQSFVAERIFNLLIQNGIDPNSGTSGLRAD
jgi:hypothetical protein